MFCSFSGGRSSFSDICSQKFNSNSFGGSDLSVSKEGKIYVPKEKSNIVESAIKVMAIVQQDPPPRNEFVSECIPEPVIVEASVTSKVLETFQSSVNSTISIRTVIIGIETGNIPLAIIGGVGAIKNLYDATQSSIEAGEISTKQGAERRAERAREVEGTSDDRSYDDRSNGLYDRSSSDYNRW